MVIALRDLTALDPGAVSQELAVVVASLQENNPSLDLRRGALHDLVAYYHAILAAQVQANIQDYLGARSLLQIQADPALADPALADDVLSNFGLTRQPGARAGGEVAVVVSADVTLTLAVGTVFQANGLAFVTDQVYTAKVEEAQINGPGDRLLTATPDGNWVFTVTVTAVVEGESSNLAKDVLIVPAVALANYVTSYANSSFMGGLTEETNQSLLLRLQQGIACKAPSNRINMAAMLRQISQFAQVTSMAIIGMGDPEMVRDQHWLFPVGGGGRVDWYVRTQEQLAQASVAALATCLAVNSAAGPSTWQLALSRDAAPGPYEILGVQRPGAGGARGCTVTEEVRSLDLTGPGWRPDVATMLEGDYSRYVTVALQFVDNDNGPAQGTVVGQTATYQVSVSYLPLIADIQDIMAGADVRSRTSDVLVKAPVPCFLKINFLITKPANQAAQDTGPLFTALAHAVSAAGPAGRLYASALYTTISGFLLEGQRASGMDMIGRLRYPGGQIKYVRSGEVLIVPDEPASLVSARTVQFFLAPTDIGATFVTAPPSDF